MKIYIASSWKNQHGVEMLTALLRSEGHEVVSFVEIETKDAHVLHEKGFESWLRTDGAHQCFVFDTEGAMTSDMVIYYSPSGQDACAEIGAAFGRGVPIFGLYAKGESIGLMRKMMTNWYFKYTDILLAVSEFAEGRLLVVETDR